MIVGMIKREIFVVIVLFAVFLAYSLRFIPSGEVIRSDGDGYYAYLPAFILHQDFNFSDKSTTSAVYNKKISEGLFLREDHGKKINQFTCGTALLWLPSFLAVHSVQSVLGDPSDGYSQPFQQAVAITAIFFLCIGLFAVYKFIRLYECGLWPSLFACFCLLAGTNLYYYAFYEPAMSHVYSFALISLFLYFTRLYFIKKRSLMFVLAAIVLGLIILVRPANGLVILLLPLSAGGFAPLLHNMAETFRQRKPALFTGILAFLLITGIQMGIWYLQTGSIFLDPYKNQSFRWTDPHMFLVWFGFRKGLFIYTPILFLSLIGLYFLFRKKISIAVAWIIFFVGFSYLVSCWWSWWYGMSYGHRAFIDILAVFAFPLALMFDKAKRLFPRIALVIIVSLLIVLNQIQTLQYRKFILHWDLMTYDKYSRVFLHTGQEWQGKLWMPQTRGMTLTDSTTLYRFYPNDFEEIYTHWETGSSLISEMKSRSKGSLGAITDGWFVMPCKFTIGLKELQDTGNFRVWFAMSGFIRDFCPNDTGEIRLVASLDSAGKNLYYRELSVIPGLKTDDWNCISAGNYIEINSPENKNLTLYFLTKSRQRKYWDDFQVCLAAGNQLQRKNPYFRMQ